MHAVCCKITSLSFTRVSGWTLNGIWSFLRRCLQASRFPLKRVKNSPPLQENCFRKGNYLGLYSGRSVLINVNKTRKHFSRNIHGAHMFPQCFPVSHTGNIVSRVRFCFQDANCAYAAEQGNFKENPSMRALAKILRARASEHSSNFCEQFEQRPNFASAFKLDGTILYPYYDFRINLVMLVNVWNHFSSASIEQEESHLKHVLLFGSYKGFVCQSAWPFLQGHPGLRRLQRRRRVLDRPWKDWKPFQDLLWHDNWRR